MIGYDINNDRLNNLKNFNDYTKEINKKDFKEAKFLEFTIILRRKFVIFYYHSAHPINLI